MNRLEAIAVACRDAIVAMTGPSVPVVPSPAASVPVAVLCDDLDRALAGAETAARSIPHTAEKAARHIAHDLGQTGVALNGGSVASDAGRAVTP